MKINDIKKISIIGVGLMGGSLALALREKLPTSYLWGFARNRDSYNKLKRLRIVDVVERDLKRIIEDADLIILALPIYTILEYLKKITPFLKKGAIVFDLGSSKQLIERYAFKVLPKRVSFVGCHPLCGSEKSGARFSCKDLYQGAICFITSSPKRKATQTIKCLWQKLGSRVVFISPSEHDKIISPLSHLPHLLSFCLTHTVPHSFLKFSPPSLRDLTRISNSSPYNWADILISNKVNVMKDIKKLIKILKKLEDILAQEQKKKLIKIIEKANKKYKLIIDSS